MKISLFDPIRHKRENFSSGKAELDAYIIKYASQDVKRNLSKAFVAHKENDENIIGYYTLSPSSFCKKALTPELQKKLPSYPLPAILIGRLAVSTPCQGKGIGSLLLMDAFFKIHQASETVLGIYAVVVDAKDNNALEFYKRFGFILFKDAPSKLFLPLKTIQDLMRNFHS